RLMTSAPDVVLSYAIQEGERRLEPTPLLEGAEWRAPGEQTTHRWAELTKGIAALESLSDESGPAMPPSSDQKGGSGLFRDMAACPFRAFVQHRMNARPLEDPALGWNPRDRGMLVHKAL